jgi:hypothetical protein
MAERKLFERLGGVDRRRIVSRSLILRRPRVVALGALILGVLVSSLLVAGATLASPSVVDPVSQARTPAWVNGATVTVQYAQNFFCDTSVSSGAASGCEVGTAANVGPVANANRSVLYVLVPLFANPDPTPMCAVASCPNHPLDIDLSRLGGAFAGATDVPLPAHSHILDGPAGGWWQLVAVPVASQAGWTALAAAKSAAGMDALEATAGSGVGPEIPTNAYLFFNVVGH